MRIGDVHPGQIVRYRLDPSATEWEVVGTPIVDIGSYLRKKKKFRKLVELRGTERQFLARDLILVRDKK